MELTPDDVMPALDNLIDDTLVSTWKSDHNRMAKYQHKLQHRVSDKFEFSGSEQAVLGVLFLRGSQIVGEIRTRCSRIHAFDSLDAVTSLLRALEENPDGPYVTMLARQEWRKESRFAHLFCAGPDETTTSGSGRVAGNTGDSGLRVEALELEVSELKLALQELELRFETFKQQFE